MMDVVLTTAYTTDIELKNRENIEWKDAYIVFLLICKHLLC